MKQSLRLFQREKISKLSTRKQLEFFNLFQTPEMSDTDSNASYPSVEEAYDPVFGLHEKFSTQKFPSVKIYFNLMKLITV